MSKLDPVLLGALRTAAADAAAAGIAVVITSGWRSAEYQDRLLEDAVAQHGSEDEASRWVATAETSAHVHGDAVDVGPDAAIEWLSFNGAWYGSARSTPTNPGISNTFPTPPRTAVRRCIRTRHGTRG